jgi:uncharacterized membrane protein YphA (DoxX/SURF4 family)
MSQDYRRKWEHIFLILGRLALAAIFLVSGYSKVKPQFAMPWSASSVRMSLTMFAMHVDSYEMLPPWAVNTVGHIVPLFELFLGVWLASGVGLRFSSVVSTLAFCMFMAAIAWAYHKGLKIKCGCGIGPDEEVGPAALIRDGLRFLPLALAVTVRAFWIRRKAAGTRPDSGI